MSALRMKVLDQLEQVLLGDRGLRANLPTEHLDLSASPGADYMPLLIRQNIAAEAGDKTGTRGYTTIHLYLEKMVNELREKFSVFSGYAVAVIEIRATHDRTDHIERVTGAYAEAVGEVLSSHAGNIGDCYFSGGYEMEFGPVKRGGRNFQQITKVRLRIEMKQS